MHRSCTRDPLFNRSAAKWGSLLRLSVALICLATSAAHSSAAVLPRDTNSAFSFVDWSRAGVQPTLAAAEGVATFPGTNIPNRTAIKTNVLDFGAKPDDSTDNAKAFQDAINATPAGGVCLIPAGVYRTSGGLMMKAGVTVRGAGRNSTIIKCTAAWSGPYFATPDAGYQYNFAGWSNAIVSGSVAGATSFTLADASNIGGIGALRVGEHLIITELDDPALVSTQSFNGTYTWNGWDSTGVNRSRAQSVRVESVSGNTVKFSPALYSSFTRTPTVSRAYRPPLVGAGLESLTIYAMSSGAPEINFQFVNAENCWLYDVRSDFASQNHVKITYSLWCEIRKCHFYEAFYHTSGSDNEVAIGLQSSANLIVDNIIERLHTGIIVDQGAAGNVIAYNYVTGEYDDTEAKDNRALQMSISANHGAHSQFNLFEGNVAQRFVADAFWGTSSHNVVLRNWFLGHGTSHGPYSTRSGTPTASYELTALRRAIDLWQGNSNYWVVGNILGDSTMSDGVYKVILGTDSRDPNYKYIWQLDYYNNYVNNVPAEYTSWGPRATLGLVDHANYDYVNKRQTFSSAITDQKAPASLFLPSRPAYFGTMSWPPFDPEAPNPRADAIPAGYRALNNGADAPGVGAAQAPTTVTIRKVQ